MKWQPFADESLRQQALATAVEIARAMREPTDPRLESGESAASLPGGHAGLALLFTYLAEAGLGDEDFRELGLRYLESAIRSACGDELGPALHGGFTGTAWTAEHLRSQFFGAADDPNGNVDDVLLSCVTDPSWSGPYDLISGLVGIGVYALERLRWEPAAGRPATHSSTAARILEAIALRLDQMAMRLPDGVAWHTAPELLPAHEREIHPNGHYNLGLAHGIPGIIALLAETFAAGIAVERVRPLLDASVPWLLTRRQDPTLESSYAWAIPAAGDGRPLDRVEPESCRLAWCYGDPGVAIALLCAARACGEKPWEAEALAIARRARRRHPDRTGVKDAGLCHGAAGLVLIFQRMFCATGEGDLGELARGWVEAILQLRRPGEGIAGFPSFNPPSASSPDWHTDRGLLTGATGVALALLAVGSELEPGWDRALLLSSASLPGGRQGAGRR